MRRPTWMVAALVLLAGVVAAQEQAWKPAASPLMTRWGRQVTPENAWREYPRPQMVRERWVNLNGLWGCAITEKDAARPQAFDTPILVPFCVESALSGVGREVTPEQAVWYRRTFKAPQLVGGDRLMLRFEAVDWDATVWVNGKPVGRHLGGFAPFAFDITAALAERSGGEHEIVVRVWDPTDQGAQPRGKQRLKPGGIWYTPVTGIWQTVWLEVEPNVALRTIGRAIDFDTGVATFTSNILDARPGLTWRVSVEGQTVSGRVDEPLVVRLNSRRVWSPNDPQLYDVSFEVWWGEKLMDRVSSYFALRKVEVRTAPDGFERVYLNNEPVFMIGTLDQGWWPDGLLTPPSAAAMAYDIEVLKKAGFNSLRKHIKVEPASYYAACDRMGMLVWQDMPSGMGAGRNQHVKVGQAADAAFTDEEKAQFRRELGEMIDHLRPFGCIVVWVPFNEGWGQHDTNEILRWVKQRDGTRLVDGPSGWEDRGFGDLLDRHHYPKPDMFPRQPGRVSVLGEFGGLGLPLEGHLWQEQKNWGYKTLNSQAELQQQFEGLVSQVLPLVDRGLSATIYTQTTDVEIEVNGLMTYDREVIKLDLERTRKAHEAVYQRALERAQGKVR